MDKNIKIIKYKPYGKAANVFKHELWLYNEPVIKTINSIVYRIVPMYKDVCVSKLGRVCSTLTGNHINNTVLDKYPTINTRDYLNGRVVMVRIHRLVALAWLPNDDFINKNIVDHIDSNRGNPIASNLRWVTASENLSLMIHGMLSRYSVVNLKTGFTVYRDSLVKVAEYLGRTHQHLSTIRLPQQVTGRGSIYTVIDNKSTKPVDSTLMVDKPKFSVTNIDNSEIEYFKTKHDVVKKYKLAIYPRTIANAKIKLKSMGYKLIDLTGASKQNSYDIKHIKTNEERCGLSLKEVIEITKCSKSVVLTRINRDYRYGQLMDNWVLKLSTEKVYTVNYRAGGGVSYTIQPNKT